MEAVASSGSLNRPKNYIGAYEGDAWIAMCTTEKVAFARDELNFGSSTSRDLALMEGAASSGPPNRAKLLCMGKLRECLDYCVRARKNNIFKRPVKSLGPGKVGI